MKNQKQLNQQHSQPVECFALALKQNALPASIKELVPLSFVGETALDFYKSKLEGLKKLGVANAQLEVTYGDALQVAEMLFRVYERLGLIVEENTANPFVSGSAGGKGVPSGNTLFPSVIKLAKELNVSRKRLEEAKCIARQPQYIDSVLSDARRREVLPSKTKLLAIIRAGSPGKSKKPKKSKLGSKHEAIEKANKESESKTLSEKCTDAILEATSYMKAIIELWENIPEEEKTDFANALFEFQLYAEQLRSRYAPEIERKGA